MLCEATHFFYIMHRESNNLYYLCKANVTFKYYEA